MGTHPIFESDFDCLTEITKKEKKIMGEVRKRKNSGEAKNGTSAAPAAAPAKSGGLGLIPVVLISALLAGSGCHVIRKDTAKSIADLSDFVGELKAKNVETGQLVEKLRNTVATKDALVESLKAAINKNEKLASLATQVDSPRADLVQLSSKMPSQVTMEKMSIQSEKAVEGLETANGLLDKHAKEINALKQAGEKELGNLDAKVTELNDSSTDAAKKVASLEESIKSTKRLVDALDGEVTGLKKRHAESVASANSAQN